MRSLPRLILVLLGIVLITAAAAPALKLATDAGVKRSRGVAKALHYKDGTYDFGKVLRRAMMAAAVLLLVWQRRKLRIAERVAGAFRPWRSAPRRLAVGFAIGLVSLAIYTAVQWLSGARAFEPNVSQGALVVGGKLLKYLLAAAAIGVAEEVLFRAFLVRAFAEGTTLAGGVLLSSLLYSLLHFFKGAYPVAPDGVLHPLIGVKVLEAFAAPLVSASVVNDLPEIVGLFLTGVVLAVAMVRSGNLYASIGLHAGWVFAIKTSKLLLAREVTGMTWLFGQSGGAGGVLSWAMLLGVLVAVLFFYRRRNGRFGPRGGEGAG